LQYKTGTVKVVSGEVLVEGTGTSWSGEIMPSDLFKLRNSTVIYEVAAVIDNTHLNLSGMYQGVTTSGEIYSITRDFTDNLHLPEINAGDVDWPAMLTKALRIIDAQFS